MRIKTLKALGIFLAVFLLISSQVIAQEDKSKRPSPPAQTSGTVGEASVTIDYSRPSLKGRDLNTLAPVGKVWRTGANEASWIEVSQDVTINGEPLKAGKYGFFTINNKEEWTIIFNEVWNQWGAYDYDSSKDVLRLKVKSSSSKDSAEQFTITMEDGKVDLLWGTKVVSFLIEG